MILNSGDIIVTNVSRDIEELWQLFSHIKENYGNSEGGYRYEKLRMSEAYKELETKVRILQVFDPATLKTDDEMKTFWVNVYNILALHGIVRFNIKLTVWERPNFFVATEYNIGGYRFSLHDILHGVLRGNKNRLFYFFPQFRDRDPRTRFTLTDLDARIHFVINFGARSCPPAKVLSINKLDDGLDGAARWFLNSPEFNFNPEQSVLICSKIFKWYKKDFGETKEARFRFFADYLDDLTLRHRFISKPSKIKIRYKPFDWYLNE